MTKRNAVVWGVGAVALVVLVWLFRTKVQFDWANFWQQLRYVSVGHIVVGIVLVYVTYFFRALLRNVTSALLDPRMNLVGRPRRCSVSRMSKCFTSVSKLHVHLTDFCA